MSLTRLKYGIETDPRDRRNESSGLGWIVVAIVVVAAISFIVTVLGRISSESDAVSRSEEPAPAIETQNHKASEILSDVPPVNIGRLEGRSPKLRSLLLRLEKSAEAGELEMQISTIEQILALRTADAADVADELLPRLGQLNLSWLFDRNNPQWVARIKVKSGDTASRIASEHGSTLASFMKLNGLTDATRLVGGREMKVM
ncbi:MAG: LysM peptidoglycan-binding domain-containing protein, partial [Kiritimatiellae bacterium]|nr:LysM peptidoglycan-binding domain-containing protein [Kiritimatiellia bacterium]